MMLRRPFTILATVLLCLALPATSAAQTADYDSPLLSGYGDIGAVEQAIFGGKGLGGGAGGVAASGAGGVAASGAGNAGTGGLDLRAPVALSGAPDGTGPRRGRTPRAGATDPAAQPDQAPAPPSPRGRVVAGDAGEGPIGGWDLVLGILCALALAACALATRRQTLEPVGR